MGSSLIAGWISAFSSLQIASMASKHSSNQWIRVKVTSRMQKIRLSLLVKEWLKFYVDIY